MLGAGTSGMLAARVLSDSFSDVVIVDRRPVDPHTAMFAGGVPQSDHLHVLLKRGQQVFDRLFPGILAELATGGGPTMMRSPFSLMAPGALAHVLARTARRALGPPPPPPVKAQLLEAAPHCAIAAGRIDR